MPEKDEQSMAMSDAYEVGMHGIAADIHSQAVRAAASQALVCIAAAHPTAACHGCDIPIWTLAECRSLCTPAT